MVGFLYKYGRFTRKEYTSETKISLRHANREINELIDKGKIIKHGEGRGVYYTLPWIVNGTINGTIKKMKIQKQRGWEKWKTKIQKQKTGGKNDKQKIKQIMDEDI